MIGDSAGPEAPEDEAPEDGPYRRCIVTGEVLPKERMLRFVVAPDGGIVPDIAHRLPGRGLWLTARRDIVATAVGKRMFARAARAPVTVPGDLAERVETLLRQRCVDLIGLARRAGKAVAGFEKVRKALRKGEVSALVAAVEGGESGRDKVRALGADLPVVEGLSAAELGRAFGRDHVVHAALGACRMTRDTLAATARLAAFRSAGSAVARPGT